MKDPLFKANGYTSECMLASQCVFVCSRFAKETSPTSLRGACPWDGGKRGREERGSGMEKGRECEDEMKGKINSYVKGRGERGEMISEEGERNFCTVELAASPSESLKYECDQTHLPCFFLCHSPPLLFSSQASHLSVVQWDNQRGLRQQC